MRRIVFFKYTKRIKEGFNLINDIEKQIILIDDCSLDNSKNIIDNFIK